MNCGGVSPDQRDRLGVVKVKLHLGPTFLRDCWETVGYFDSQRGDNRKGEGFCWGDRTGHSNSGGRAVEPVRQSVEPLPSLLSYPSCSYPLYHGL